MTITTKHNKSDGELDDFLSSIMGDDCPPESDYVNYITREIVLDGGIDKDTFRRYVMAIIRMNKEDEMEELPPEERMPITIYINCHGGDQVSGMTLIDIIKASKTPIVGVATMAYSMAVPILLACHTKLCYPSSTFLIHDGGINISDSMNKAKDLYKFVMKQEDYYEKYMLEHTKIPKRLFRQKSRVEWFMDSQDALKHGLVDKILTEIV
jgi:ATP-dependent protease ClpP protease subunit